MFAFDDLVHLIYTFHIHPLGPVVQNLAKLLANVMLKFLS